MISQDYFSPRSITIKDGEVQDVNNLKINNTLEDEISMNFLEERGSSN